MRAQPYGGVLLALPQLVGIYPECTCGAWVGHLGALIHIAGCDAVGQSAKFASSVLEPKPKTLKVLTSAGTPWLAPLPVKTGIKFSRRARQAKTNYKLVLQFFFHRPVNIDLWKHIKAPVGWRKCPTSRDAQQKYYGVRFQCKNLKHSLTPEEIETLRAKLYLALEPSF